MPSALLIHCAFHAEARLLLENFKLKRDLSIQAFEFYKSEQVFLVISGMGALRTAAIVGAGLQHLMHALNIPANQITALNFGICGAPSTYPIGSSLYINSFYDTSSGKAWYPDILIKHNFKEAALETHPTPVGSDQTPPLKPVDLEAFAFITAAGLFLKPQAIHSVKVVSDHFDCKIPSKSAVDDWIRPCLPDLNELAESLLEYSSEAPRQLEESELQLLNKVSRALSLSFAQRAIFAKRLQEHRVLARQFDEISILIEQELAQEGHANKDRFKKVIGLFSAT